MILIALWALLQMAGSVAIASPAGAWNYQASLGGRLLPLGAGVFGHLGYDLPVWGDPRSEFLFGYLQTSLNLGTSLVVNSAVLELEIRPISLVGFFFGEKDSVRFSDLSTVDCRQVRCQGNLGSTFFRTELTLGAGNYFTVYGVKLSLFHPSESSLPFADESSALVGRAGSEQMFSHDLILARRFDPTFFAGFYFVSDHMLGSTSNNEHESLFFRKKSGVWTYEAGAGTYRSSTQSRSPTVYGFIQWNGVSGLGLH